MDSHLRPDRGEGPRPSFPPLPIVTPPAPPRRSAREKYGGVFYLGLVGLATVVALVGWFASGAWSLRDVWSNVYVLHDASRPDVERIRAAWTLSRDPRVNQRQRWDIVLRRGLPDLARYLLAESLTAEAASADPRGYALAVARSPGWPDWLRLLLARPMAYAAVDGVTFPREPLDELAHSPDVATGHWARFVLAVQRPGDRDQLAALEAASQSEGADGELARRLAEAARLGGHPQEQKARLDQATRELRTGHPAAARLWQGWRVVEGHLERGAVPELH